MANTETQPYHHGDLKRAILDTAFTMIAEQQDWRFTLREVARRAGVSHSAPYNHFADKAALLTELALIGFERLSAHLSEAEDGDHGDAAAALIILAARYLQFATANPALYRLMYLGTEDTRDAVYGNERALGALGYVEAILRRGQELGTVHAMPPRSMAVACWAHIHGLAMLVITGLLKLDGSETELFGPDPVGVSIRGMLFGLMPAPNTSAIPV